MTGARQLREAVDGVQLARPGRTALAVALRPDLWATAVRLGLRTAGRGWWRRWPLVPLPPVAYLVFRSETMLGGTGEHALAPNEVVAYLRWCRGMRAIGG